MKTNMKAFPQNLKKFLKKNDEDIFILLVLVILIFNAWQKLLILTIRADGLLYMLSKSHVEFFILRPWFFTGFENSAMIVGLIFSKTLGANIPLYYWVTLIVLSAISIMWYLAIKQISNKKIVGFSAALMFAINYFGVWDMITSHCYCFFLERVIPVLFLIPSFIFLHKFLVTKNNKALYRALILYFLGIGFGHFVVMFTPLFLFYPIFWFIFEYKNIKEKIKGFKFGLFFLLISAFFILIQQINESALGPHNWTFMQFLLNPVKYQYIKKIFLQLVYWSQYPLIIKNYAENSLQSIIEPAKAYQVITNFVLVYVIAAIVIYRKLPKQRALMLTTLFGTLTIFYLNAYFNQYDMVSFSGASRYLFFPSFLLTLFWTLFLWAVFWQKKNRLTILGTCFLALFYVVNIWLIEGNFSYILFWDRPAKAVFNFVASERPILKKNTLVIAPYPEFGPQESMFFTEQLGKDEVRYMSVHNSDDIDTWEKQASKSAHVVKLSYDEKCNCVLEEKIK